VIFTYQLSSRIAVVCLFATLPVVCHALDPAEERLGFVALSDGKTFPDWKLNGNWVIEDGAFARVRPSDLSAMPERTGSQAAATIPVADVLDGRPGDNVMIQELLQIAECLGRSRAIEQDVFEGAGEEPV
jgi:hypothetical protein